MKIYILINMADVFTIFVFQTPVLYNRSQDISVAPTIPRYLNSYVNEEKINCH